MEQKELSSQVVLQKFLRLVVQMVKSVVNYSFQGSNLVSAADKLLSRNYPRGVAGNVTLPAANKVLSDTSFGVSDGTQGTVVTCSSNGDDNCYVDSSSIYDAADLSNLLAEKY